MALIIRSNYDAKHRYCVMRHYRGRIHSGNRVSILKDLIDNIAYRCSLQLSIKGYDYGFSQDPRC